MAERPPTLQELIRRRQAGGFVGRREHLGRFEENLGLPVDDPRRRFLFSLHGAAGVGKTFLVQQFARLARERGVLTAYTDEAVYDVPAAIEAVVAALAAQGGRCREFPDLLAEYRRRRHELEADPGTPEEMSSALTRTVVRVGLRAAGDVPLLGAVAEEVDGDAVAGQVDRLRAFLGRKFRNHDDVRLLLSPVEVLTPAFVRDLSAIAESRPVALFFDTYERTGAFLDPWLRDLLAGRYGALPGNLLLTVAGQSPLDANRWGDYLAVRTDIPLQAFTDVEARQLLADRGVTDEHVVGTILELSGRLPVWVATLASTRPGTAQEVGDPSGSAVERFLKWEPDERRRAAALGGALPRRVDRDAFAAATGASEEDFAWLRRLPFVVEHADGYRYHDVVRAAMLRVSRRLSTSDWQRRHEALAEHHRAAREALGLTGYRAWKDHQWQRLAVEEHYHRLCAHTAAALPGALGGLVDAIARAPDLIGPWTRMIRQAGKDAGSAAVAERAAALPEVASAEDDRLVDLLTDLIGDSALPDRDRGNALSERGILHREAGRYDEALADFDAAVALRPDADWIVAGRGVARRLAEHYQEALADFDRAIGLDPRYDWAIASRGETYRLLGRHEEALADFDRAIELDPKYAWAIASRGGTYRLLGRHEEALADFDRAVELAPSSAWAVGSRGEAHQLLGRYEEALADFDRAIELDPTYAWAIAMRGLVHRTAERFEEALADFDRAVEVKPDYAWAILSRGETHRALGRFEQALADFHRSVELDPLDDWRVAQRGEVHRLLGHHDEALADFERSLELDPDNAWSVYQCALVLLATGREDEARERLLHAVDRERSYLESLPRDAWRGFNIAVYLLALGRTGEARRQVLEVLESAPPRHDVITAVRDLEELRATTGCDIGELTALLLPAGGGPRPEGRGGRPAQ